MSRLRDSVWPSFVAAAAIHAAALGWVALRPPAPPPPRPRPPVTLRLAARPAPAPPPPAQPTTPSRPDAPRRALRALVPTEPTRPAAATPSPATPPAPRRFAVSMDALVTGGGGVAVPTTAGPTAARGDPTLPASAPVGDNTAVAAPSDLTEVERAPSLLRQPSSLDLRSAYPEAARRDRIEADVRLQLLVTGEGAVADVKVVGGAGAAFDQAAVALARRMLFRPAMRGGRPVTVWLPWTWKFRLDD